MHRRGYPLTVMHEYRMTSRAITATRDYIEKADLEELRGILGISHERMILVPWAVQVLGVLIKNFKPRDITISSYGIREGMLYEQMPVSLREKDPLIEACHFSEQKDARMPGFGPLLYDFVLPLFARSGAQKKRIIRAACLLHDVSWRAHPDYRAEVCFDNTTRANLGGLKHEERIYMGLALLHRYSNKREGSRYEHLFTLLPDKDVKEAEVLGRAMRLGAVLWLGAHSAPGKLKWRPQKKLLELRLTKAAEPLFGEVVEGRFKSLASALGGSAKVIIGR